MRPPFDAFADHRALTDEQRALVGGRGADTRSIEEWRGLLEPLAAYESVRARALAIVRWLAIGLAVVTGLFVGMALRPPLNLELNREWLWAAAVFGVLWALAVDGFLLLRRRAVERHLTHVILPLVRSLQEEQGPHASLYLALRLDRARPTRQVDVRWLEGAVALGDGSLLHLGARDVVEGTRVRTWLRATLSRPEGELHPHAIGEGDPTVSGLTRVVADEARREGNPFSSMEMLALREAHGVQREMLRLEAFVEQRVPPPPVGEVLGEASCGIDGGRGCKDVTAARLLELAREARGQTP